jgi:hypothetical protein
MDPGRGPPRAVDVGAGGDGDDGGAGGFKRILREQQVTAILSCEV